MVVVMLTPAIVTVVVTMIAFVVAVCAMFVVPIPVRMLASIALPDPAVLHEVHRLAASAISSPTPKKLWWSQSIWSLAAANSPYLRMCGL